MVRSEKELKLNGDGPPRERAQKPNMEVGVFVAPYPLARSMLVTNGV